MRAPGARPFIYPLDSPQPARAALRGGSVAASPARRGSRQDAWRNPATMRGRRCSLLGADSYRPRRVQPAPVRRADVARAGARRRARRNAPWQRAGRDRRLRRRQRRRCADAGDRISCSCCRRCTSRSRSVGDAARAVGRGRSSCCSPRSSPWSARRSSRAACAAIVRSERRLDYAAAPPSLGAEPRPRLLVRHLLPAARGFVAVAVDDARAGLHRRGGDAVVRRPRISGSRWPAGARCCTKRRASARSPTFRGC